MRPTVTRRQVLRTSGGAALGLAGALALAACGETQVVTVEKVVEKEVPVERIVTKEVPVEKVVTREVVKEVTAQRGAVKIELHHDHSSGPRGAAMSWALDRFQQTNPNILIRFVPQTDDFFDVFAIKIAAGTNGEIALLTGDMLAKWVQEGDAFTQVNEPLNKHPNWDPSTIFHSVDEYGLVFWNRVPSAFLEPVFGPMWGLPYQGNLFVFGYNLDILDSAGIEFPAEGSWGLETEYLEALKKATDPEIGQWGMRLNADDAYVEMWPIALADRDDLMSNYNADATHYEVYDDGGDRGLQFAVDIIHKHKVSFSPEATKELAGEFGSPFRAGKVLVDKMGGATGYNVAAIKDRFSWSLGPPPEGRYGPVPNKVGGQPHLVSGNAAKLGTVEEAVDVIVFFAGEEVQTRIGIDRGSFPVYKGVLDKPEFAAAPPENHGQMIKDIVRTDHRHGQQAHPATREILQAGPGRDKMILGEETVEEGVPKLVTAKDRVLQNTLGQYNSLKTWVESLPS